MCLLCLQHIKWDYTVCAITNDQGGILIISDCRIMVMSPSACCTFSATFSSPPRMPVSCRSTVLHSAYLSAVSHLISPLSSAQSDSGQLLESESRRSAEKERFVSFPLHFFIWACWLGQNSNLQFV